MYTVGVYVKFFCQQYLKIKQFHVFVGGVGNFFPGVYVVQHALNCKVKQDQNIFCKVSIIFSHVNKFPNFLHCFFGIIIIWRSSIDGCRSSSIMVRIESISQCIFISYVSLHCYLYNQKCYFFFLGVFISGSSSISSAEYSSSSSGSLSRSSS